MNEIIVINLKQALDYLIENTPSNEDEIFYKSIVANIANTVLENSKDLRADRGDSFNQAVDMLDKVISNHESAYKISSSILDLIISDIVLHIPDYDHGKYDEILTYEIDAERSFVRITIHQSK